jgi:hypothetical protein
MIMTSPKDSFIAFTKNVYSLGHLPAVMSAVLYGLRTVTHSSCDVTSRNIITSNKRRVLPLLLHEQLNETWEQEDWPRTGTSATPHDRLQWAALLGKVRNSTTSSIPKHRAPTRWHYKWAVSWSKKDRLDFLLCGPSASRKRRDAVSTTQATNDITIQQCTSGCACVKRKDD